MSDDFCITHGYDHMKRDRGPIPYCAECDRETEAAAELSRLTTSPLPDEIAGLLALKEGLPEGPWTLSVGLVCVWGPVQNQEDEARQIILRLSDCSEPVARAIAALPSLFAALRAQAEEVERLTQPSNPPITMHDALALLAAQGREIERLLEKDQLRDKYVERQAARISELEAEVERRRVNEMALGAAVQRRQDRINQFEDNAAALKEWREIAERRGVELGEMEEERQKLREQIANIPDGISKETDEIMLAQKARIAELEAALARACDFLAAMPCDRRDISTNRAALLKVSRRALNQPEAGATNNQVT